MRSQLGQQVKPQQFTDKIPQTRHKTYYKKKINKIFRLIKLSSDIFFRLGITVVPVINKNV